MFEGSAVALVTPFKDGEVDEKALAELVEFHVAGGTATLVPCGTTGESATLSHEEHGRVIQRVIACARGRVQVLAGAGSNSTREAVAFTRHAREAGADGALHITPYYNRPTQRGLIEHFRAVARSADIPIVLYNVPGRTGVNMQASTVIELARLEKSIVGVKEASGNMDQVSDIVRQADPSFAVLSGDDSLTLPIMAIGGRGVISVAANIVPKDVAALCAAALAGRWADARDLHLRLFALCKALFVETSPAPVKTAMGWLNLCAPDLRLPLAPLEPASRDVLEKALREHGLATPLVRS